MILRHIASILLLPTMVTVVVPATILSGEPMREWMRDLSSGSSVVPTSVGVAVIALGLALVVRTVTHFALRGEGTLAPWDPPRRLVVTGVYRHVRNPMITGVVLVLVGEALAFTSIRLAVWALVFLMINAIYIPLIEEPGLARRFGSDYREYKQNVPRWVPRLKPWTPSWDLDAKAQGPKH